MTCDEFSSEIDMTLGHPRRRPSLTPAARRHLAGCPLCRHRWARTCQLVRARDAVAGDDPSGSALRRARQRLQRTLAQSGRPAVRFDWIRTPVGIVFVSVSDQGVCDVTFDETSVDRYLTRVARWATDVERDTRAVASALEQIDSYFAGLRTTFSLPVDLRRATAFASRVLAATRKIAFGRVVSYGDIAKRIGSPRASRAVGGALGRNPVPIIVPCHRVIGQTRRLGGFTGGVAVKRALLQLEGHTVEEGGRMVS